LSYLKVESIALANNGTAALTFFAASNNTYTVESRAAAGAGAWPRVSDVIGRLKICATRNAVARLPNSP
jgi:hypothetical protein